MSPAVTHDPSDYGQSAAPAPEAVQFKAPEPAKAPVVPAPAATPVDVDYFTGICEAARPGGWASSDALALCASGAEGLYDSCKAQAALGATMDETSAMVGGIITSLGLTTEGENIAIAACALGYTEGSG